MYSFIFRNKIAALGFVALMAFSAANLVGTEENEGMLLETADQLDETRAEFEQAAREFETPEERPVIVEDYEEDISRDETSAVLASDDDLIDDTAGFDPTPVDEFEQMQVADNNEEVMVVVDEQGSE